MKILLNLFLHKDHIEQDIKDIINPIEQEEKNIVSMKIDYISHMMMNVMSFDEYIEILDKSNNMGELIAFCIWEKPEMKSRFARFL